MAADFLNLRESARLLNVPEAMMRRWLRQGLFRPSDPSGERIGRAELLGWAREHGINAAADRSRPSEHAADLLADSVARGAVTVGCDPTSAAEAIELAVEAVPGLTAASRESLLADVLERERMASTAIGHGVALPHPRKPPSELVSDPVVSACFPERALDWAAIDGEPVSVVLLVLSPSAPVHLQLVARIAAVLRGTDSLAFLRGRPTQDELVLHLLSIRKDT